MHLTGNSLMAASMGAAKLSGVLLRGAAIAVFGLGSAAALAASHLDINCMESAVLHSNDGHEGLLEIDVVDLTTSATADMEELRNPAGVAVDDETSAPHLFLGPRVATIVRDVFGEEESSESTELVEVDELGTAPTLSPLAERAEPASDQSDDTGVAIEDAGYSPLSIHQEMYRTDI